MSLVVSCLVLAQERCPLIASQSAAPKCCACHADIWPQLTGRTTGQTEVMLSPIIFTHYTLEILIKLNGRLFIEKRKMTFSRCYSLRVQTDLKLRKARQLHRDKCNI